VNAVAAGESLAAPLVVELDPTSFCDMRCPECISIELLNDARFPRERLLSLAKEFAELGVRAVILIGGGEPLMHNAIGDVIDILGRAGIAVGPTTNGTMIHRYLEPIAEFGSWTRVSVDAGTAETFERFRPHRTGRNVFDRVIDNMRQLAAVKRGSLGYSFLLVARTTPDGALVESNFGDVAAAAVLARDIGCDYFEVKPTYDLAHFLVAQPPGLGDLLADQLHQAHETATGGFEVLSPRTLATVMDERQYVEPKGYHHCPVAELRTLVTATGAYVCPYHRGNPHARYGNPLTESFAEMWSGQRRHDVKTGIDPATECRFHCIRHQSNLLLLRMAHEDLSSEVVPDHDPFL
jgi:sulfatase maturation enzyme AslB (radical SAM superfamily)